MLTTINLYSRSNRYRILSFSYFLGLDVLIFQSLQQGYPDVAVTRFCLSHCLLPRCLQSLLKLFLDPHLYFLPHSHPLYSWRMIVVVFSCKGWRYVVCRKWLGGILSWDLVWTTAQKALIHVYWAFSASQPIFWLWHVNNRTVKTEVHCLFLCCRFFAYLDIGGCFETLFLSQVFLSVWVKWVDNLN